MTNPTPPAAASDAAIAQAFREFGDRSANSDPRTATGAVAWVLSRAREIQSAQQGGGEPPPNWCRTCGKHRDAPDAVFCSDGIHNRKEAALASKADGGRFLTNDQVQAIKDAAYRDGYERRHLEVLGALV